MPRRGAAALLILACAFALAGPPAAGQSREEVNRRLDALFGDHRLYEAFLRALKQAVAGADAPAVAAMVSNPLGIGVGGDRVTIRSQEEFLARYEEIVTPDVASAIEKQSYAGVFANADGVMIGDGEVWFSGVCGDAACTQQRIRIIAINP
jgi:hypothetical protein